MKIKKCYLTVILVIAAFIAVGCGTSGSSAAAASPYDSFAKCLSASGAKMYGAYWCSHCLSQKEMFGDSFKYVNYIECSLPNRAGQTQVCADAGIEAYPTWEFGDGSRAVGEVPFGQLSQNSNCRLE